jgi:Eukaryotic aspartyl protease
MPSYFILLITIILVSLVLGAPAEIPSRQLKKRSFKVERVPNPNFAGHDGAAALRKAYIKWGMHPPTAAAVDNLGHSHFNHSHSDHSHSNHSSKAPSGTTNGSVEAKPVGNDVEYVSPIQIGGQTLNMDFDTGSADLWVFNTQLPQTAQNGHKVYDPSKSTSFQSIQGASFSIKYGDASAAAGNVGTDTVVIGGATVTSQAVEMATALSSSFVKSKASDGLLGLAFSKLNTVKPNRQKTFFDNALPTLPEPVFTASLKHGTVGSYDFGVIDPTKFNGPLTWAPVNSTNGFWQVSSSQFSINNGTPVATTSSNAIIDTGTTLMLVNPIIVNAYYSQVPGARNSAQDGGIEFPCSSVLPDLQVDIGGTYMANIPGSLIKFTNTKTPGARKFSFHSHCFWHGEDGLIV